MCCVNLKCLRLRKSIHGFNIQLDVIATTTLVDSYSKYKKLMQARELFDGMEKRDAISYDAMMAGYFHNNFACEALDFC